MTHNGSEIEFIDYGQLSNQLRYFLWNWIRNFQPYISGSTLKVDFTSNLGLSTTGFGATVNTWFVALADTDYSGVGSTALDMENLSLLMSRSLHLHHQLLT